jgi:hypothetical protein
VLSLLLVLDNHVARMMQVPPHFAGKPAFKRHALELLLHPLFGDVMAGQSPAAASFSAFGPLHDAGVTRSWENVAGESLWNGPWPSGVPQRTVAAADDAARYLRGLLGPNVLAARLNAAQAAALRRLEP